MKVCSEFYTSYITLLGHVDYTQFPVIACWYVVGVME